MRRHSAGYALLIILASLAVMLLVFVSLMSWVIGNNKVTARTNQYVSSQAAAEAATERVLSQMTYDYIMQSLSNSVTYYGSLIPALTNEQASWPVKFVYSDTNGVANQISVNLGPWTTNTVPLGSQYTNLYGLEQSCTITATATPVGQPYNVPATVQEVIQFATIPLFQFAIFYNMDLEIDPGAAMTIAGSVWSNGGIWSGTPNVSYTSSVGAAGVINLTGTDPFCGTKTDSGNGTPLANFSSTPISGMDRITMPIGTNNDPTTVEAIINLPPAPYTLNTSGAISTNGQLYFANSADLYLTNSPSGTNWTTLAPQGTNMTLYYQDGVNTPIQTKIPYDFFTVTNYSAKSQIITNFFSTNMLTSTNYLVLFAGYSFLTNTTFVDWREGWNSGKAKTVQAVQIDLKLYNTWLTNVAISNGGSTFNNQCMQSDHKSHPIDSIYIYNAVPLTGTTLPAVRVYNGAMMPTQTAPHGFTVATAMPMYVYKDYNATNTSGTSLSKNSTAYCWPAALIADSITVLSDNWIDSTTTTMPLATATTVNAAMLEGIVRSTNNVYSGGVENFLRLLENWSSVNLWYNGSIVVMFPSQIATNLQQATGNYYNAPTRMWAFDTNFITQAKLPPITPQAKGVIRYSWNPSQKQ
jgi:hypothetical protein